MKQTQPPHVQQEEFMKSILGDNVATMRGTRFIGCKAIIGSAVTGSAGITAMIEPDFDGDTADSIVVTVINKSCGPISAMSFNLEAFTVPPVSVKKGEFEAIGTPQIELDNNELKWATITPHEKRLEPLRYAITRYLSVWL